MKRCARCKEQKPETEFPYGKRWKDGLFPYCYPCKRSYQNERFARQIPAPRRFPMRGQTKIHGETEWIPSAELQAIQSPRPRFTEKLDQVLTEAEWAYFAGILDGEGSIGILRGGSRRGTSLTVRVANTNGALIDWLVQRFGSQRRAERRPNPKHKPIFRWALGHGQSIEAVLRGALPYLIIKHEQAELALTILKERANREHDLSEAVLRLRRLNRRGVP